jgi:LytS/YehU family sensor histidine kinase
MPPMVLLPLIDHAIVHGLGPARASGKLRIACEALGGKLRVLVADSGAGFVPGSQADGLSSIQQRLAALYGVEGKLELQQGPGEQTHALMEIPLEEPREFAADADTERAAVSGDRPAAHAAA